MSQNVFVSRLHWPVTTLGYGQRIGIWFQGCSIGCKGCCSADTWTPTAEHQITVGDLLDWVQAQPLDEVDGFTISGGEPFDQPFALARLLHGLRSVRNRKDGQSRDLLIYSGYPWIRLLSRDYAALRLVDAVISEPFIATRPGDHLRGSGNQKLHYITDLGRDRSLAISAKNSAPKMQMHFDGKSVWLIGIPREKDLSRLGLRLANAGVSLGRVSWLA